MQILHLLTRSQTYVKTFFSNYAISEEYLSVDSAILVANALVTSRLDYCNTLLRSLSCANTHRLQCIQNTLACIVTNTGRYTRATPFLGGSIGCLSNIVACSNWLPWYISFSTMVLLATLVPPLYPIVAAKTHNAETQTRGSLFLSSANPSTSQRNFSTIVLLLIHLQCGTTSLTMSEQLLPLPPSEKGSKLIYST